jgi:outer membrane protein assembly factor BamA
LGALKVSRRVRTLTAALVAAGIAACAEVPPDRYGVNQVRIEGTDQMSAQSLENCLATTERAHLSFTLGIITPGACGNPPFDATPPRLELWAWPWTVWPTLDRIALERDRKRVERWYEARGFHHAEVVDVSVDPPQASEDDTLPEDAADPPCERRDEDEGCVANVTLEVREGEPTRIEQIQFEGLTGHPESLQQDLRDAVRLEAGKRFDEALYDRSKQKMKEVLAREGYALAKVRGVARVDRSARKAWVTFEVNPGPKCVFGEVVVEGEKYLPEEPIAEAVLISPGDPYDFDDIVEAQHAVRALGAFSGVTVEPVLPEQGNVVDVRVEVTPAREDSVSLGGGIQAGELQTRTENISVPQWDLHLLARYRNSNLLGGMRQLTIEERPRMIVQEPFPDVTTPRFGNTINVEFRQPGLLEPRLMGIARASYVYGPDPFDVFFRHRVDTELALERRFFDGIVYARIGLHNSVYRVPSGEQRFDGSAPPTNSLLTFPEQILRLDLRDEPNRTHRGAMVQLTVQEAGYFLPSSWDYVRLLPDVRLYAPLPFGVTLAGRFALGMYFITGADADLGSEQQRLGPRDYRLRGGGASSNRGFLPGTLGDGLDGGTRRWEASLELRIPVLKDLSLALFSDMGDVNEQEQFRFDHPQMASGFGLRYYTLIGAIRLDFAWKIPGMQVLAQTDEREAIEPPRTRGGDFVFHLTIGEPF